MAEQQTVVVTAEHLALAATVYDGVEELALERAEPDFVQTVAEQLAMFQHDVGHMARCHEELDAWSNSAEEWEAYKAANPVFGATVPVDPDGPCRVCAAEHRGELDGDGLCVACRPGGSVVVDGATGTPLPAVVVETPVVVVDEAAVQGLLKAFGRQARRAADASLEMGRLASEYVTARMLLSDKVTRDACTKTLVSVWQESADDVVTVQRVGALIRLYQTSVAFPAVEGCKRPSLRQYKAFAVLVQRNDKLRAETWAVDPDMAADAGLLWTEAAEKGLSGEECEGAVATLVKRAAEAAVQAKKAKAVAEHTAALKAQEALAKEAQATAAVENAAKLAAAAAAAPAKDADKAALTAASEVAKAALLAQQATEAKARQEAEALAQQLARTQAEQRVAAAKQADVDAKAAVKAARKATDGGPSAAPPAAPVNQGANLLTAAAKGTAKDVASMSAKLVTANTAPDDVFLEQLRILAHSPELSAVGKRAALAAIAVYNTPTVPVSLPAAADRNGVTVAA